jgi:hypothetical protein
MKTWKTLALVALVAFVPLVAIAAIALGITVDRLLPLFGAGAMGVGMALAVGDADATTKITTALRNGAGTVSSTGFDLGHGARGDVVADFELQITIPAIPVANLPNSKTLIVDVYHDTAANFGSEVLLMGSVIVVTGATATDPSIAVTKSVRLPVDCHRYVRVKATQNDTSGDCSAYSMVSQLRF